MEPEPIVINGVTWTPYKWPKIDGFHWGEISPYSLGALERSARGPPSIPLCQVPSSPTLRSTNIAIENGPGFFRFVSPLEDGDTSMNLY